MAHQQHNSIFLLLVIACMGMGADVEFRYAVPYAAVGALAGDFESGTILFVGDIMLGRDVETKTDRYGQAYPFAETQALIEHTDVAIGNFEGAIPLLHRPTPPHDLQFSIRASTMKVLKTIGFDGLSLANNHAYDYGVSGYLHTRAVCAAATIVCMGHPGDIAEPDVFSVGSSEVAVLSIHAVDGVPDSGVLTDVLARMTAMSDIQIAYIHWGNEYETTHNAHQETFAKVLIDGGIDAVVGHHPHVVQDIGVYKNAPIFYSLGNFVFDQYFSDEVQTELAIRIEIAPTAMRYTLIPVTSIDTHTQPAIMDVDARDVFMGEMRERSDDIVPYFKDGALLFAR